MESLVYISAGSTSDYEDYLLLDSKLFFYHRDIRPDIIKDCFYSIDPVQFENMIRSKSYFIFFARTKDNTIGFALAKKCAYKDHASIRDMVVVELVKIFVERQYRNQGVGKILLSQIIDCARECGAEKIELNIWAQNDLAERLYNRFGFAKRYERLELDI